MTDPNAALTSALADRYTIERELGRGGMATVFLAFDIKHRRRVAIKVFRPEIAVALGSGRFLREIEIAAQLQHPNILALYDSGEAAGLPYYVMPYVEGMSLAQRLERERQLAIDDTVRITREVALALTQAHARGVIHRDIKPANILLSNDAAMVADFGIARAMAEVGGDQLTSTGFSLGTPTYMSPEQALGGQVDGRSDLYSLACVAYEMLSGEPPFSGSNAQALLARHSLDPVPRLRTLRSTVTPAMEAVIFRALSKAPADRQATVMEFATQLADAVHDTTVPVAKSRSRIPRSAVWAGATLALALGIWGATVFFRPAAAAAAGPPKLAVLPFESIGKPEDQYIADGMSDEITSRVSGMSGLVVIAQRSSGPLAKSGRDIPDLARELRVGYVLTGKVRTDRKPDGTGVIRVTPTLMRASDGKVIWNDSYDRALAPGELLEMQSIIADGVAHALSVTLLVQEKLALAARPTDNPVAYESYLRGNIYATMNYAEEPSRHAVEMYERAVAADPKFALAWAKLSQAHTRYFYFEQSPARLAQAETAAGRAMAIDSTLPEAHLALGLLAYLGHLDYDRAQKEFERVRTARPNDSEVLSYLATLQRRRGQFEESIVTGKLAAELDPRSQQYALELSVSYLMTRRFAEADLELARAIELAPDGLVARVTRSFLIWSWTNDLDSARAVMREALKTHSMRELLTYVMLANPQYILTLGGEFQDSLDAMGPKDVTIDPAFLYQAKGLSLRRRGDRRSVAYFDSARAAWEPRTKARPQEWRYHSQLGLSYAGMGRREDALREGRAAVVLLPLSLDAQSGTYPLTTMVTIAILTGEPDTAVAYLRPLLEHPSQISPNLLRHESLFDPLRNNPGFRQLIR